jgi:hypothetical protein
MSTTEWPQQLQKRQQEQEHKNMDASHTAGWTLTTVETLGIEGFQQQQNATQQHEC